MDFSFRFSSQQVAHFCSDLQKPLVPSQLVSCLEIQKRSWLFLFEKEKKKTKLLLSFQPLFSRFHITSYKGLAKPFALTALLEGATLLQLFSIKEDRIVHFKFFKNGQILWLICEFFHRSPNVYLTNKEKKILFSLSPYKSKTYLPPTLAPPTLLPSEKLLSHQQIDLLYQSKEKNWQWIESKRQLQAHLLNKLKKLQVKKDKLCCQLEKCEQWQQMSHLADLMKANLSHYKRGISSLTVWDWLEQKEKKLTLDSKYSLKEVMEKAYQQAKNLQKGIEPTKKQLDLTSQQIKDSEAKLKQLESLSLEEVSVMQAALSSFHQENKKKHLAKKTLPYHQYFSSQGVAILVGKNSQANEQLTFSIAKGNDWWLHVCGHPGSHVVIKLSMKEKLHPETLQDALQLALHYSKARQQALAEVIVTQKKYIRRLGKKGSGKVQVSKPTTYVVKADLKRLEAIKKRARFIGKS